MEKGRRKKGEGMREWKGRRRKKLKLVEKRGEGRSRDEEMLLFFIPVCVLYIFHFISSTYTI